MHVAEEVAPLAEEYVPAGQEAHASLCEVPPRFVPYVPAGQVPPHSAFWPTLLEKVPTGQATHEDTELPPEEVEYVPAGQAVQVVEEVAPVTVE